MTPDEEKRMAGLEQALWEAKRRTKEIIEAMAKKHQQDCSDYECTLGRLMAKKFMLENQVKQLQAEVDRNEGRRIFQVCLNYGARPGNVNLWLKDKLEKIQKLEQQVSDAGWEAENRRMADLDRDVEGWK